VMSTLDESLNTPTARKPWRAPLGITAGSG
jgi:hypothetical protein